MASVRDVGFSADRRKATPQPLTEEDRVAGPTRCDIPEISACL